MVLIKKQNEPRTPMLRREEVGVEIVPKPKPIPPEISDQRVAELLDEVATRFRLHPVVITGTSRVERVVRARHAWIAAVMREYKLSLSHAARYFGLDRDTIRNAMKKNLIREVERELRINGHI